MGASKKLLGISGVPSPEVETAPAGEEAFL
jgi:hypothetical protein